MLAGRRQEPFLPLRLPLNVASPNSRDALRDPGSRCLPRPLVSIAREICFPSFGVVSTVGTIVKTRYPGNLAKPIPLCHPEFPETPKRQYDVVPQGYPCNQTAYVAIPKTQVRVLGPTHQPIVGDVEFGILQCHPRDSEMKRRRRILMKMRQHSFRIPLGSEK